MFTILAHEKLDVSVLNLIVGYRHSNFISFVEFLTVDWIRSLFFNPFKLVIV